MTIQKEDMAVNIARGLGRIPISNSNWALTPPTVSRIQNMFMSPTNGAMGDGDRGAFSSVPLYSGNPYDSQNYLWRWRQYVHLYEVTWEARKIVRIPVEDALRKPWEAEDIPEEAGKKIYGKLKRLGFNRILQRSLMLERLLGGCLTFCGTESNVDDPSAPLNPKMGTTLRFLNAIPISRISRMNWDTNPLSQWYMRPKNYLINGEEVHVSRFMVWDGEPLFDPYDFALTNFRANLAGFGPSKLAPIWDDIVKAVGTRQAAYQLIQTNNALIMKVNALQDLSGTNTGRETLKQIKQIANQLSVYRAALIQKDGVEVNQHSASFGSVPELIITYLQVLSAASDIPATRFLGQSPGGLNATGESDLENYYNMIDCFQRERIEPALRFVYDILGYNMFPSQWPAWREKLTFVFPPLWNINELEEAQKNQVELQNLMSAYEQRLISEEKVIEELNAKGIFSVTLDESDIGILEEFEDLRDDLDGAINGNNSIAKNPEERPQVGRDTGDPGGSNPLNKKPTSPTPPKKSKSGPGANKLGIDEAHDDDATKRLPTKNSTTFVRTKNQFIPVDSVDRNPSPARKSAGNYRKFHTRLHGFDISIENPMGSERTGTTPDGTEWRSILPAHYGYIKRTEGADGDHVDVFLGPHDESQEIFVIDQVNPDTKEFDEHKCIFGALGMTQAKALYLEAFSDGRGPDRVGSITPLTVEQFKQWLKDGDTTKPYHSEDE